MSERNWSVSGVCVTARPEHLASVRDAVNELPRVDVHAIDPTSGRLVAVQEGASLAEHQDGLRAIQALPRVLTADLVAHYQDPEALERGGA